MRFLASVILLLGTLHGVFGYDSADIRFEVENIGYKKLTIKAFEGTRSLLNQTVDPQFNQTLIFGQNVLSRHDNGYKILYKGSDQTLLGLEIDADGNISIQNSDQKTGFSLRKSWGFKTSGTIQHTGNSLFFKVFTKAKAFHNHGILKSYMGHFSQNYLFNQGIFHFGNETDCVDPLAYLDYLIFSKPNAEPSFQKGIIDDHGTIIAEKGLIIKNLVHRIHGFLDVDEGLELQDAGIENKNALNVSGPIRGTVNRFSNEGLLTADSLQSEDFRMREWNNSGSVYLRNASQILSLDKWDNTGEIFVGGNTSVGSKKIPDSLWILLSEGEIKAIIEEAMDEATTQALFGTAEFISKKRKIIIDRLQHTDHLLNTITRHHVNGRFTHTTETGYVFQNRTTEKKQETIDSGDERSSEVVDQAKQEFQGKRDFLDAFKKNLKDKLKKLGIVNANRSGLLAALMKGLKEAGLSDDELEDIFGQTDLVGIINLAASYEQIDSAAQQTLATNLPEINRFLNSISLQAKGLGMPVLQWAQRNGPEFVGGVCDAFMLASRFTNHPGVLVPASACALGKMIPRSIQHIEKAQAFFSKRHEGTGKSQGRGEQGHVGSHQPVKTPKALPAFPNAAREERKTYVQGGGAMRGRWKDKDYIYEWDSRHGRVEKYNKRGNHLGEFDPNTGAQLKPADPNKSVEP
jgi:hypothetical protein